MPKVVKTKEKIMIFLDIDLVKRLIGTKIKASQLINGLLWKHYSQDSNLLF